MPGHDRILRYPDGVVRTIRYPSSAPVASQAATLRSEASDPAGADADSPGWTICGEHDAGCTLAADYELDSSLPGAAPVDTLWGMQPNCYDDSATPRTNHDAQSAAADSEPSTQSSPHSATRDADSAPSRVHELDQLDRSDVSSMPDSPAEFLRFLQSDDYKKKQQEEQELVRGSYELLTGSPWVTSRQLSVLALQQVDEEHPTVYTLPTSMPRVRSMLAVLLPTCTLHGADCNTQCASHCM